jgi:cytidyltransferase-like protein
LKQIENSNISEYSIFESDEILFSRMLYTGADFEHDMQLMAMDETTRDWWILTDDLQVPFSFRKENEWWACLEQSFTLYPSVSNKGNTQSRYGFMIPTIDFQIIKDKINEIFELNGIHITECYASPEGVFIYVSADASVSANTIQNNVNTIFSKEHNSILMQEVFHHQKPLQVVPKVFVSGCFDMLHSGHVAFLQEAASYGDLYVSIGSDENVHHLKGRYPVNTENERSYMIRALGCVKQCLINSGSGLIDFMNELTEVKPDIFVVNEDGHSPAKQNLCNEQNLDYKILKRIPHADLPVRSTTALRTECTIPFRIDLAGGWLDQPYVSKYHPGPVLTISIEPGIEFNDRSGMSSSTRRKAIELWHNEIPHGDNVQLARLLFSYENPPGTPHVSGSQDSLGIVLPGLNRLDYENGYWPVQITSVHEDEILNWLENHICLVTLGPRTNSYSPLENTNITSEGAENLSKAADACWEAILKKDIDSFGLAFTQSFESQIAMFPNMVDNDILQTIENYKSIAKGWKLSGAGGGGYIILVCDTLVEGSMQIKIRRKTQLI